MSSAHALQMLRTSTQLFVATLGCWLVLAMLTTRVRVAGVLANAVQVQLLLVSVALSFEYAMTIAHAASPHQLPRLDEAWLTLGAGSNGIFLAQGLRNRFVNPGPSAR